MNVMLRHWIAGFAGALPAAALAQDEGAASALPWLDLLTPLLLLATAAALSAWWLRRRGGLLRRDGPLRLVQVLPVGPREKLLVVQVDAQPDCLLIGVTPTRITALGRVPVAPPSGADTEL